jgi:hypothetical protein
VLIFHLLCSLKVEAIGEIEIAIKLLRDDCDLIYLSNIYIWIRKNCFFIEASCDGMSEFYELD